MIGSQCGPERVVERVRVFGGAVEQRVAAHVEDAVLEERVLFRRVVFVEVFLVGDVR